MPFERSRRLFLPRTIRARITAWGMVVTLGVCVCLCIILYFSLQRSLHREIDNFLEGEVSEFKTILVEEDQEGDLSEVESEIRRELGSRLRSDLMFRLLDSNGKRLVTSDPHETLPNPWVPAPLSNSPRNKPAWSTVTPTGGNAPLRVCSSWVVLAHGKSFIAQAAYRLDGVERSLATFRRICATALAAASLLALAGGYFLARRSLRPLDAMTQTARRISADQISQRLDRSGNQDEMDRLAATLNEMLDRLERHVRQVRQFTADASHELRTPLTALRGAAEVALSRPRTAEELRVVLEESIEHYARLARIAEDLLLLAHLDAGQLPLDKRPLRLDEAVEDVVDLYSPLAQEHGVHLWLDQRQELWVDADGARLRQVIGNIMDNSIKYIGDGRKIQVTVSSQNGTARVTIADDGIGVAADDLPHVYDRFYRADRARSKTSGAGLGLSICRSIARAHGGDIHLESTPGQGTQAMLELPLRARPCEPAPRP